MHWYTIDYYGITTLDPKIVDLLNQFLLEKEARLGHQILQILPTKIETPSTLKLCDAVEGFIKQVRLFGKMDSRDEKEKKVGEVSKRLNAILWEFAETIEGCSIELFKQVDHIPVYQWDETFFEVVQALKDILIHHIDELTWSTRRLDQYLKEYREKRDGAPSSKWMKWVNKGASSEIDPQISHYLAQCYQLLEVEFSNFYEQFHKFEALDKKIDESIEKYREFSLLPLLEEMDQSYYHDVVKLLKFWEENQKNQSDEDILRVNSALRNIASIQFILGMYNDYYENIRASLFRCSLELKEGGISDVFEPLLKTTLKERAHNFQNELKEFLSTLNKHRRFLLNTDPNPYVRSRWGFTEVPVGPEPHYTKEILALIYKGEELDRWYSQFIVSIDKKDEQAHLTQMEEDIEKILHEMALPLISQKMIARCADRLVKKIKGCDELGSDSIELIPFIEKVLNKAMRLDWKYHVLHEMPEFHEVYHIHKGLRKETEEVAHGSRMQRFHELCQRINKWLSAEDFINHSDEIEWDKNDIKVYLQDFFASTQRVSKMNSKDPGFDKLVEKLRHQLLEYRYLFGNFFYSLRSQGSDGSLLRNQFLFVDQYLESIEGLCQEVISLKKNDKDVF